MGIKKVISFNSARNAKTPAKAQSAMEFIIIVGAIIAFFSVFMIIVAGNVSDLNKKKDLSSLKNIALQIQTEISLASKSSEGYHREFALPQLINGKNYSMNITDSRIFIRNEQNALSINVENVQGDVKKGMNIIKKNNGIIQLNP